MRMAHSESPRRARAVPRGPPLTGCPLATGPPGPGPLSHPSATSGLPVPVSEGSFDESPVPSWCDSGSSGPRARLRVASALRLGPPAGPPPRRLAPTRKRRAELEFKGPATGRKLAEIPRPPLAAATEGS
jgi:hypothetical protein